MLDGLRGLDEPPEQEDVWNAGAVSGSWETGWCV